MTHYVVAIDQGTTGTKAVVLDRQLRIRGMASQEFTQYYPKPGWVEHEPEEIWQTCQKALARALRAAKVTPHDIAAIGITNQRETSVLWNKKTGKPVYRAIVWQDRRSADVCKKLKEEGVEEIFQKKTGLLLDPYFSGTKVAWLLQHVKGLREKAQTGEIVFGTIDSWLVYKLTGGEIHVTDVSNASRTLLLNLNTLNWDAELLKILGIPREMLPEVRSSSEVYGTTAKSSGLPAGIPIAGIAGDQQAALFGQACFEIGSAKLTFGTGSFLLINTGDRIVPSQHRLLTSVGWKIRNKVTYVVEGSAFIAGAMVQWLRDGLGIIKHSSEVEALATSVSDSGGLIIVPALAGLGAPYWRSEARGLIWGLNRGTTKAHIARAALEGIAFQNNDLAKAMEEDIGERLTLLKVDGGACSNDLLMQFQADAMNTEIVRPQITETTSLGAAFLAGLAVGIWKKMDEIRATWKTDKRFHPKIKEQDRELALRRWAEAVRRSF